MMIDIRQPGCSGLCGGIFSSLQGWLCVGVLCALQCAKNCVGSCRQSRGCLNVCRMLNRVTHNVSAWRCGGIPCYVSPDMLLIKDMKMKIYSKAGLYSSDRYVAE